MVTEAGKELLRNTINTAKFHNKILEENEMWKQWELERGLTMMVSDDDVLKRIRKHHQCAKHSRCKISKGKDRCKGGDPGSPIAGSSKDRWDHSGFQELYPEGVDDKKVSSSLNSKVDSKRWDHSGFQELYPDETDSDTSSSSSSSRTSSKRHKKRRRHRSETSSSNSEIWEEFKQYKRGKSKREPKESSSSNSDNRVKQWKKKKRK